MGGGHPRPMSLFCKGDSLISGRTVIASPGGVCQAGTPRPSSEGPRMKRTAGAESGLSLYATCSLASAPAFQATAVLAQKAIIT
eukprot:508528-Prorocentrum_minimum.AAC.2